MVYKSEKQEKYEQYKNILMKPTVVIGRDDISVENANFEAKKNKGKTMFNISIAKQGALGNPEYSIKGQTFYNLEKKLKAEKNNPAINSCIADIEQLKTDSKTGLYTKSGADSERIKNKNQKYAVIFIDLDDMHYWNQKEGYRNVDERINSTGQAINYIVNGSKESMKKELEKIINNSFRTKQRRTQAGRRQSQTETTQEKRITENDRRKEDRRECWEGKYDIVQKISEESIAFRVNEEAGDEFKVYIPIEEYNNDTIRMLMNISERLIENIYDRQIELLEKRQRVKPQIV